MLLRLFQAQIAFQCRAVSFAADDVNTAIRHFNCGRTDAMSRLWFGIQNMLTAAANISKACWGQDDKRTKEREPLRESLGINGESPLRSRAMRNKFEHYDERLDSWWETSKRHNHADMNVGSIGGIDPIDSFRELDPQTLEVIFWGDRYDLRAIVSEAERILPVAASEAAKPHSIPKG